MIAKENLAHGQYYWGSCRNASTARWDANRQKFVYWRRKFGDKFTEEINHPEDDDGYDLFTPTSMVTWGTEEIPLDS